MCKSTTCDCKYYKTKGYIAEIWEGNSHTFYFKIGPTNGYKFSTKRDGKDENFIVLKRQKKCNSECNSEFKIFKDDDTSPQLFEPKYLIVEVSNLHFNELFKNFINYNQIVFSFILKSIPKESCCKDPDIWKMQLIKLISKEIE